MSASELLAQEGLTLDAVLDDEQGEQTSRSKKEAPEKPAEPSKKKRSKRKSDDARLYVDIGKDDQIEKADLLECLESGGFQRSRVSGVLIRQRHSFVFVAPEDVDEALDILDGGDVAGYDVVAELSASKG